jgi:hypothetical protein
MRRTIVGIALFATSVICMAQQNTGDALSGALNERLPGRPMPDLKLPIYLKTGSLICRRITGMRRIAEEAARASDADQDRILKQGGCAIAPADTRVSFVLLDEKSWDGTLAKAQGLAKVSWLQSNGTPDAGFVGIAALRN